MMLQHLNQLIVPMVGTLLQKSLHLGPHFVNCYFGEVRDRNTFLVGKASIYRVIVR